MVQRKSPLSGGGLPGKLADCSSRDASQCELFLVEGEIFYVLSVEECRAVDKVDVFVAIVSCSEVALHHHVATGDIVLIEVEIGSCDHKIGDVGVLFSYFEIDVVMRCTEMLGVRRIMVIVRYERAHRER